MNRILFLFLALLLAVPAFGQETADVTCGDTPPTDPDGDAIEITWEPLPGVTFSNGGTGFSITLTRQDLQVGTYDLRCTATDEHGAATTATVARLIVTLNRQPVIQVTPTLPTILWILPAEDIGALVPITQPNWQSVIDVVSCDGLADFDSRGVRRPQILIDGCGDTCCDAGPTEYQDFEIWARMFLNEIP